MTFQIGANFPLILRDFPSYMSSRDNMAFQAIYHIVHLNIWMASTPAQKNQVYGSMTIWICICQKPKVWDIPPVCNCLKNSQKLWFSRTLLGPDKLLSSEGKLIMLFALKRGSMQNARHRHLVPLIHLSLRLLKPLIQYCPVSIYILHGIHASSCNKWSNMIGYHQIWSKHTIQVKTKHNDACSRVSTMYSCQFGKFLSPLLTTNLQTQVPSSHSIFIILICARLEASHWSGPQCYRAQVLYPKRAVSKCPSTWTNMGWTHLSMLTDIPQTNIICVPGYLSLRIYTVWRSGDMLPSCTISKHKPHMIWLNLYHTLN